MSKIAASVAAIALALLPGQPSALAWANAVDNDTACGFTTGGAQLNCAHISISRTSGSCVILNKGTTSEELRCTASTYSASGDALGWITPGSYTMTLSSYPGRGSAPCTQSNTSESKTLGPTSPPATSGPWTVSCPGFSVFWGECLGNAGAIVRMTFTGEFVPRSLSADAGVNNLSDGCNPS